MILLLLQKLSILFLHCCEYLNKSKNVNIKFVDINSGGELDLKHLEDIIKKHSQSLVTLMHGNNEIGNINDLKTISKICEKYDTIFHSDTVQTVGHYHIDLNEINMQGIVGSNLSFMGKKVLAFYI